MQIHVNELEPMILAMALCRASDKGRVHNSVSIHSVLNEVRAELILWLTEKPKSGYSIRLFEDNGNRIRTFKVGKMVNLAHAGVHQDVEKILALKSNKTLLQEDRLDILTELLSLSMEVHIEPTSVKGKYDERARPLTEHPKLATYFQLAKEMDLFWPTAFEYLWENFNVCELEEPEPELPKGKDYLLSVSVANLDLSKSVTLANVLKELKQKPVKESELETLLLAGCVHRLNASGREQTLIKVIKLLSQQVAPAVTRKLKSATRGKHRLISDSSGAPVEDSVIEPKVISASKRLEDKIAFAFELYNPPKDKVAYLLETLLYGTEPDPFQLLEDPWNHHPDEFKNQREPA